MLKLQAAFLFAMVCIVLKKNPSEKMNSGVLGAVEPSFLFRRIDFVQVYPYEKQH